VADDREAEAERKKLRERTEQMEEEMREKDKRWNRTVDRLQRQVCDLTRKNQELEEEVKRAGLQAQQAQFGPGRSASATTSTRGRRPSSATRAQTPTSGIRAQGTAAESGPAWQAWQAQSGASGAERRPTGSGSEARLRGRPRADSLGAEHGRSVPRISPVMYDDAGSGAGVGQADGSADVHEVRSKDGRSERRYKDGRGEIEFANGLRKVIHPDGRTQVFFQNGDEKEIRAMV